MLRSRPTDPAGGRCPTRQGSRLRLALTPVHDPAPAPPRHNWRTGPKPPPRHPWPQRPPRSAACRWLGRPCRRRPRPPSGRSRRPARAAARRVPGMAGKKGVAAFEAVHDADGHQRVDGPVDRDRRQPFAARGQPGQHLVGADGLVRGGDLGKHGPAQARQLETLVFEGLARPVHRLGEAMAMVVLGRREGTAGQEWRHRPLIASGRCHASHERGKQQIFCRALKASAAA